MNVQETLAQIDHIMTEVDLELYQWQTDLDMMSFIGVNASIELWTNDDPPVVISEKVMTEALVKAAGKELRVMHYVDGKPSQVGTAVIGPDGIAAVRIDKEVPGLMDIGRNAFSIDNNMSIRPMPTRPKHPPFEGLNKPLTVRGLEEAITKDEERIHSQREWLKSTHTDLHKLAREMPQEEFVQLHRELKIQHDLDEHPFFKNDKEN